MTDYLDKLNENQKQAVCAPLGPVLVLAGAGSGKTRVLTCRILYLVKECGIKPFNVLAITFTNKAANEMKERLLASDCNAEMMRISTIHSFCAYVLRQDADKLQYASNFTIYDQPDKEGLLKKIVKSVNPDDENDVNYWVDLVDEAKLEGESALDELGRKVYELYVSRMKECNAMDFDDLLFNVHKLFTLFPDVLEKYRDRFPVVCIDEFQDTNRIQYEIFRMLSQKSGNIFVVGDDDQSIYSWRGADVRNMFDFEKDFPTAKVFTLEQNYRSTKKILALANALIGKNQHRHEKTLFTENSDGNKVETFSAYNEQDEAYFVVQQIIALKYSRDLQFSDFAVLMRINALSRSFEQECNKYRIPYRVVGGFKFFERKEVKDVLAYLKLIDNPFDNEAFSRAVSFPKRGIGATTLEKVSALSSDMGLSAVDVISDERNLESIAPSSRKKLCDFYKFYSEMKELSDNKPIYEFVHTLLDVLDVRNVFLQNDDDERALNIDELEQSVLDYQKGNVNGTVSDFLQTSVLSQDRDDGDTTDRVTISTIHGVKGLEFSVVFVVGLEDGLFPVSRATYSADDLQEERRLMYVAATRAEKRLYLTRAQSRFLYGSRRNTVESTYFKEATRFLAPKPQPLYDEDVLFSGKNERSIAARPQQQKPPTSAKSTHELGQFKAGQKVSHSAFGEGIVLKYEDGIADVAFASAGKKRINVKFSPLTIIK